VRAYAAPVDRVTGSFPAFDPAGQDSSISTRPRSLVDLGAVENFHRTALTKYEALRTVQPPTSPCNTALNPRPV